MKNYFKYLKSLVLSHESGQALIIVLVFILLGTLTLIPTMAHMSTALQSGVAYENKSNEFFTADAGIENGLWRIKYDDLGPTYSPYDYDTVFSYQTDPVNNRNAAVTIQNIWLPTNITLDSLGINPEAAETMVDAEKLVISGTSGAVPGQPYHIKVEFSPATGDNLTVKSIGVWLPQGFTYANNCTLETGGLYTAYHPNSETITTVPGGTSIVWRYSPPYPTFTSFPNMDSENGTMTSTITFSYTPPASNPTKLPLAVCWMTTDQVTDSPIAWDTDTRYYKITSDSGKTQIETYSSKSQLRKLGDAIAGSYVAVGNSLMIGNQVRRDQLLSSSSCNTSTVNPIPADADVLQAILYWTGFRFAGSIFNDSCDNFNNWNRSNDDGSQTALPTGDGANSGTRHMLQIRLPTGAGDTSQISSGTYASLDECSWDNVAWNTSDYEKTGTTAGYGLFTYAAPAIPAGATINSVNVYQYTRDDTSGTNYIRECLKVKGIRYEGSTAHNPGTTATFYSTSWTTNPNTTLAWTVADVNGSGSSPLQQFGFGGITDNDWNPAFRVCSCWMTIDYDLAGSYYTTVDETTPDYTDGEYFNASSGSSYQHFTFPAFNIPANCPITDLKITYSACEFDANTSQGTNNVRAGLKVNGIQYDTTDSGNDPGYTPSTYTCTFAVNPNTNLAWTADDINGTGTHPLQQIGFATSDSSPPVLFSAVYAQVDYTSDSLWTISSSRFRGQGSSSGTTNARTLTLKNSIDLSSYTPGTIALYWSQTTSGTLASTDALYYAVSGDGGNTWSSNIQAFSGGSPSSPFWAAVPSANMTANFKFRFYFNFDSSSKYVYLDDIRVLTIPPDTDVTFQINGQQVYLDASNQPQAGSQKLTASSSASLVNPTGLDSGKYGYSYACHRDVTKLVQKYPIVAGEQHHTGNALYTVGDVTADTGQEISYAGWSLILIYTSPETAGHYLYLNDLFSWCTANTDLDFDNDGQPGGDITGFVIPEPIRDRNGNITESVAANLTCFVGEGDAQYTGDSVMISGQQSANHEYLSNSASPSNNVWNSADTVSSYPGVDIDTFTVYWSDNILTPGDTQLHLDLNTQTDRWNLIYIIISVRSETVTGGTENFIIHATS